MFISSCRSLSFFSQTTRKTLVWIFLVFVYSTGSLAAPISPASKAPPSNILLQASQTLSKIAHQAAPAVVSITSIKALEKGPFERREAANPQDQLTLGVGSGVIIRSDGLILTNHHVVRGAKKVTVAIHIKETEKKVSAHVLGSDPKTDLAVLQLDQPPNPQLPTLSFGDSNQVQVGDWALAVGNPFGLSHSVTLGIVSAIGRAQLGMLDIEDFIQTDAAINPGNSGGPLLNAKGEMVGINTAIFSESGGFIGIGLSIPSKIAKQVFNEIVVNGRVIRGWVGMTAQDLDSELAKHFHSPQDKGALVSVVTPNSPADQASLRVGDIITKYGDTSIQTANQLKSLVSKTKSKSKIEIEFSRHGKVKHSFLTIREQPKPAAQEAGMAAPHEKAPNDLGISVQDIPPEINELFGIPSNTGAIISNIRPGSPAFDSGLAMGDIILTANKKKVRNAKDVQDQLDLSKKNTESTILYVQRGPEEKIFVTLSSGSIESASSPKAKAGTPYAFQPGY